MKLCVYGINHKTAAVDIREQFFLNSLQRDKLLDVLKEDLQISEAFVLSTCNRTEIYVNMSDNVFSNHLRNILFDIVGVKEKEIYQSHFYSYYDEACVKHLLNVSTGLDSLVIGEKQILGQFKKFIDLARKKRLFSKEFNLLTNIAVRSGKMAQSQTEISCGGASVSWAAVKMAEQQWGNLQDKSVLIVGAGKMSSLTATHLKNKGIRKTYVVNRTKQKAVDLADQIGGEAYSYLDLYRILGNVDLCIVSASAPEYVLQRDYVQTIMHRRGCKELLCIDISTPRNIDPQINELLNVKLLQIDDLQNVVAENMKKREAAVIEVQDIIDTKISEYYRKINKINSFHSSATTPFKFGYSHHI